MHRQLKTFGIPSFDSRKFLDESDKGGGKKRNSKTCITAVEEDDPDTGKEGQTSGRGQRPGKMLQRKGGSMNFWIFRLGKQRKN